MIIQLSNSRVNPAGFPAILDKYKNNLKMKLEETPYFLVSLKGRRPKEILDVLELLGKILQDFQTVIEEAK